MLNLFLNCVFAQTPVVGHAKKPTAQIAHLVFADTRAKAEKPKELFFANSLTKLNEQNELINRC